MDYEHGKKLDTIIELLQALLAKNVKFSDEDSDDEALEELAEDIDGLQDDFTEGFQEEEVDPAYVKHIEEEFGNYDDDDSGEDLSCDDDEIVDDDEIIEEEPLPEQPVPVKKVVKKVAVKPNTKLPATEKKQPEPKELSAEEKRMREIEEGMF